MTAPSYVQRKIDVTFSLGTGTFGAGTPNTVTVTGLRCSATIVKAGGASMGQLNLRIRGMTLSQMNTLSTLGLLVTEVPKNSISVMAGDDQSGMSLVFQGTIYSAWADFHSAPDVIFNVTASVGLFEAVKPVPAVSYKGPVDVAVIMSGIATSMGVAFENNGVSVKLSDSYFPSTNWVKARAVAKAANINMTLDNGTLAIWPKGSARGSLVPLISPETGMVGYPTYTSSGLAVTTLYNPAIGYGSKVQIQSSLTPACGEWIVQTLTYDLESETVGGAWFASIQLAKPGYTVVTK